MSCSAREGLSLRYLYHMSYFHTISTMYIRTDRQSNLYKRPLFKIYTVCHPITSTLRHLTKLPRAGPRRSKDGGALTTEGIIERRKPREGESMRRKPREGESMRRKPREGESMREVSPLIRGSGGLPQEIFKLRLSENAFPCYFQVIFINLAG